MTLTQLSEYNGKKKPQVYLACKGIVFDVSASGKQRKIVEIVERFYYVVNS